MFLFGLVPDIDTHFNLFSFPCYKLEILISSSIVSVLQQFLVHLCEFYHMYALVHCILNLEKIEIDLVPSLSMFAKTYVMHCSPLVIKCCSIHDVVCNCIMIFQVFQLYFAGVLSLGHVIAHVLCIVVNFGSVKGPTPTLPTHTSWFKNSARSCRVKSWSKSKQARVHCIYSFFLIFKTQST